MPRRRPPKHVREATRAAREKGEEPPQVKPSENKPLFSNPRSEAKFGDQLRDKIAKAQIQAKQKLTGFAREANCQKPMLNLGISPLVLQGKWSDVAGNTVNVYPCDNYCNSFWVTLTRPCGPDINLTLTASPNGKGWYCGSARLDERGSTLTQLIWEFFNGEISIWTRNVQSNEQFDPFGSSCMDYYGYEDGLYVVPHMLTPICDFHNNLITSPMCYVVIQVDRKRGERTRSQPRRQGEEDDLWQGGCRQGQASTWSHEGVPIIDLRRIYHQAASGAALQDIAVGMAAWQ
mmetsp:Transcript_139592/g.246477  ORF Transcript_139592/g.246477 Transcript_139592/m.246477 type:complete len:290 (-) Transcript_139592:11-880(-)